VFHYSYTTSKAEKEFIFKNGVVCYQGGKIMDAIIGRYRLRMEESGLLLGHMSGINFDLTVDETLGLMDFLNAYRQTLSTIQQDNQRETDPCMERVVVEKIEENS